jgi:ABC-type multidrug transport system fused ATPase/permease subunit
VLKKLQTISPRARVAISASEVQTLFAKMEGFTAALSMPGQAKVVLEVATLPIGFFFLQRLFGFAAIGASVVIGGGVIALASKVGDQKTKSEQKLRSLRKKQEAILNELAANLPIWKLYGWADYFVERLNKLTGEMETVGRWNAFWKTLSEVLPNTIGPTAVLISVGINVLLGGKVELVKLLTAGSYITIISSSMQKVTESRQQWRDLCAECANIDEMFELPDSEPLKRSSDGSIRLTDASFGWPTKPPTAYKVKADGTACAPLAAGEASSTLHEGDVVESVDGQKKDESVRVKTKDGQANGWVKAAALKKLPDKKLGDWPEPSPGIAGVNLHITQGELVLISGPVASGKSTLLQSLVGNTEMLGGDLAVPHSVAFQPQSPILFDQTIRANILFGIDEEEANEEWIQQSLEASTLSLDMDDPESTLHAKRELTSAGQNGSELSGGQQARVALARCIYASLAGSECVILDDPIKALDPHTAAKCWDNMKDAMAGKTRVMVVNSQMLQRFASDKAVTKLIIIENDGDGTAGRISYNGKPHGMPHSLQQSLGDGYTMMEEPPALEASGDATPRATPEKKKAPAVDTAEATPASSAKTVPESPGARHDREMREKKSKQKSSDAKKKDGDGKRKPKKKGSIPAAVTAYCRRMGPWIIASAVGNVLTQTAGLTLFWWNEKWALDSWGLGFRRNYAIAIVFMLFAQATRFFQGVTDGGGREVASKSIRLDTNKKLAQLAMPYLVRTHLPSFACPVGFQSHGLTRKLCLL